ncbi:MAG: glycosyltransferase family 2 protein [Candidatus Diapherotrites archaeon]|uniref:Glycosyltransferase family 2 protein n=1 Tax=Candidatus Iainarchaeum sp. TaxID=3101447 RepID=A0A8T4L9I4_9ARCH|nr:glycosyltransferase family 2 protein [Candidatus Diapherotrites archaeon]
MGLQRFISVVIPVHTRRSELEKNLLALERQTYPKTRFEVVCVGQNENALPESFCRPERFSKTRKNFSFFSIPSRWPDAKRNAGIKKSRGEIVAFTDDDCLVAEDWLEKINLAFEQNPKIAGVEGKTVGQSELLFSHATKNECGGLYPTCNMAFQKNALQQVNGFDERYHFFREDIDLAFAVQKNAGPIVFDDHVVVVHPERKTSGLSVLNELKMFRGDVLLFKKYPAEYKRTFGWLGKGALKQSFATFFLLVMFSVFLELGFPVAALGMVFAWIVFKFFLLMRKKKFSLIEGVLFLIASGAKDLLAPVYYFKYWLEVNEKEKG